MRRFIIAVMALALSIGTAFADIPDPSIFSRRDPADLPEVKATASMKVEPVKEQKNILRLRLTMTGAGHYTFSVREEAGEHAVCSGQGDSEEPGKELEALFPHREISGDMKARYIAEATFVPLNSPGSVQVIRQVLAVCLINGSIAVTEELDAPEII
ncbi:MAG: hypothetical protein K6E38_05800 [Fretibacterium sp.]|nr:hypothetical protein [Fretibacterium sp.]